MAKTKIFIGEIMKTQAEALASLELALDAQTTAQGLKIDEQIDELQNMVSAQQQSISSVNVKAGVTNTVTFTHSQGYSPDVGEYGQFLAIKSFATGLVNFYCSMTFESSARYGGIYYSVDGGATKTKLCNGAYSVSEQLPVTAGDTILLYVCASDAGYWVRVTENSAQIKYDLADIFIDGVFAGA